MVRFDDKVNKTETEQQKFVIVTVADCWKQAKDYEALLKANDIPAVLQGQDEHPMSDPGFAVMVPKDRLNEARVCIESQDIHDDYIYPISEDEEDDDDFDDDIFEDDSDLW